MASCSVCEREMKTEGHCTHGIDESVLEPVKKLGLELRRCRDCNVVPGACHHPGCDTERCGNCRGQAIGCGCGQFDRDEWLDDYGDDYEDDASREQALKEAKAEAEINEETYWVERPNNRWLGVSEGTIQCHMMGWFCRSIYPDGTIVTYGENGTWDFERSRKPGMRWHVPCKKDDEGASEDLNRWARHGYPSVKDLELRLAGRVRP